MDQRKSYGYPNGWEVPSRNRQFSNQPGGLAEPEQVMVRDFEPEDPRSDHMRYAADLLREGPSVEDSMDYNESSQPDE